jgi:hypothetical protein
MAVDFQVVFAQELIELTSVQEIQGFTPRTLDVLGKDFRAVDEVTVNGLPSPEVVIVSRRRLMAQVPRQLGLSPVSGVSVLSNKLAITEKSVLRFRLGQTTSKVTGILRLVQIFLKVLFTTPGSDIFAPRIGAGALKNLGLTFGVSQGTNVVSDFIVAVGTAQRQILAIQARDPTIPLDERLLTAKVTTAGYNVQESALHVSVEVTSQTGRAALANVAV